jgi:hypothetical protein
VKLPGLSGIWKRKKHDFLPGAEDVSGKGYNQAELRLEDSQSQPGY